MPSLHITQKSLQKTLWYFPFVLDNATQHLKRSIVIRKIHWKLFLNRKVIEQKQILLWQSQCRCVSVAALETYWNDAFILLADRSVWLSKEIVSVVSAKVCRTWKQSIECFCLRVSSLGIWLQVSRAIWHFLFLSKCCSCLLQERQFSSSQNYTLHGVTSTACSRIMERWRYLCCSDPKRKEEIHSISYQFISA